MRVFTCNNFEGHFPVGTAAVIVADNVVDAMRALNTELKGIGLPDDVKAGDLVEVDTDVPSVDILCDGDY